ncbi:MAG: penicillin-binding protein 1C [Gallionellaceae bacterium]|nr:penicillin-binding protein 1C [Gallionellaceae bacterium]
MPTLSHPLPAVWRRVAFFLLLAAFCQSTQAAPTGFDQVRSSWPSSEAKLLDRHGELLQEIRLDNHARRTDWTALADVSPAMQAAVLLAEDHRFFAHNGVDWLATAKAALTNWLAEKPRGASTISMQVAALVDADLMARAGRRSVIEKWRQMKAAKALEASWTKAQILEAYLNLTSFRGDLIGIDAAARALFDKRPAGLGTAESLILAALIRGPGAKPDIVARRACGLAEALTGGPDCRAITRLARNSLTGRHPIVAAANLAPQLARRLLSKPGQRLVSTLDAGLQKGVVGILHEQLVRLAEHQVEDAAALVADNRTGEVLAYVSLSGRTSASPESDGVVAPRQAGSTLKPFLYSLAIERRYLTAASPLDDTALTLATPGGSYAPENYDRRFRGLASVRTALAGSLNIPAVRTVELVGVDLFAERLASLGFAGLTEAADFYGPALALGSLDVSLWELANAYRSLANQGRRSELTFTTGQTKSLRVIDSNAAFIVADILSDRAARATTFGLESALATPWWTAVKTGTSKDMRDNWCIGFSDRYTVGVWVGNFSGEPMHDVSGISGAAPAWRLIMERLHAGNPSRPPKAPATLVRMEVSPPGEATRQEWFIAGTEPGAPAWTAARPPAAIVQPADGDILAIDPDIPPLNQRLHLRAVNQPAGSRWLVDEVALDGEDWPLARGRHRLKLLDGDNRELDQVEFEVR